MGVGPAPWKLLRDRAAKDPGLLGGSEVPRQGEGGKQSGGNSGLFF